MLQQMIRDPETRRMMFSPEMMRMQMNMQRAMNQNGQGGGGSSFPAPGATDNTPQPGATATPGQPTAAPAAGGAQPNPFASLFTGGANPFAPQQNAGTDSNNTTAQNPAANAFGDIFGGAQGQGGANPVADMARSMMQNPQAMQQMMQMMNGGQGGGAANPFGGAGAGAGGANPFAALMGGAGGGFGAPPAPAAPADTRPPEEIYQSQLAQLNEMGFYEFDRNVSALRRSGGNVQGAIEYLLGGGV
jgi:hypothetical protein